MKRLKHTESLSYAEYHDIIKKYLSPRRFSHSLGVVRTGLELAEIFDESNEKIQLAAIFHDLCRDWTVEKLNEYVKKFCLDEVYLDNSDLSHGKVAAELLFFSYGINDLDIINAVRYHTTARAGMSKLEKIIFVSDAIEPSRDYEKVDYLRELAKINLDSACFFTLEDTIKYLNKGNKQIHKDTILAYEEFKAQMSSYTVGGINEQ